MREGARPSPSNQARVIDGSLALAQRENFQVNVIEAFDQPWKRWFEGGVGGEWGIFDRATGAPKFGFAGGAVSDHPHWRLQALAGMLLAALMFGGALAGARHKRAPPLLWLRIAALTFLPCILFGWTIEAVPVDSFTLGSWLRSLALAATAVFAPIVCAIACACGRQPPTLSSLLGGVKERKDALAWALGGTLIALVLLAMLTALGLVFDPRYHEIPFAPVSAAVFAFLILFLSAPRPEGWREISRGRSRAMAETTAAAVLAVSAIYIALNESFANWQAVWFAAALLGLAFMLAQARDAPG
jgi:glucan 1,3-beta-glucosidase